MSCCPTVVKPVASSYKPLGTTAYIAGTPGASAKGVILVPDIFGFHPNAYHLADVLAANGYVAILPDLFPNNTSWPTTNWPPNFESAEWKDFHVRITTMGPYVEELKKCSDLLKGFGCTSVGVVGLCWGAKPALAAFKDGTGVSCCCPHPSFLCVEDVIPAKGPIAFLMSKDEAPHLDVKTSLEGNAFASKNVFVRFDDLHHGFLGARGPLQEAFASVTDDAIANRVAEASEVVIAFLKNTL
jgi:dienelactone hydrolase